MDGNRKIPTTDKSAPSRQIPAQGQAARPTAQPSSETRQMPAQKQAQRPTDQSGSETRQMPAQRQTVRPAAQSGSETRQMPAQRQAVRPTDQSGSETRQMPAQRQAVRPTDQPGAETRQMPAQRQAVRPTDQPGAETRQMPAQKQAVRPTDQSGSETRQMPAQRQAVRPTDQSGAETRQMPAQRQAVRPTDQPGAETRQMPAQRQVAGEAPATVSSDKSPADLSKTKQVPVVSVPDGTPAANDNNGTKVMSTVSDEETSPKKKARKEKNDDERDGNTIISIIKAVVYIVAVLVISVASSLFIILVGNDMFAFVKSDEVITVTIPEDADISDISSILSENGIIKYPGIFEWYADHKEDDGKFIKGTYEVACNQDYDDLLAAFKKQVDKGTSWITIPEGFTTDEIIDLMVESGIGTKEGYIDVINNYPFDYWFVHELDELDWKADGRYYRLDGYLFPDTYEFYNDSSEKTVIGKLLARFNVIYGKKYKEATEAMGMTADQVVIIASMIEKEAGQPSDYHLISSVFHNRLNSQYYPKMESDATALYAIHHDTGERPTEVTGVHMQYDSPYNTYLYDGLPPGPIANPSASSINAALTPETTDYYYFVSYANHTLYGRTNNEHEYNKAQIQILKDQAAGNPQR